MHFYAQILGDLGRTTVPKKLLKFLLLKKCHKSSKILGGGVVRPVLEETKLKLHFIFFWGGGEARLAWGSSAINRATLSFFVRNENFFIKYIFF